MNPRVEYEMTEEDLKELLDACKSTPVMFLSGGQPMCSSAQENANQAWSSLGKKMGFDAMSVRPSNKGQRFFTAVLSETEAQRIERVKQEAENRRLERITELQNRIKGIQKELAELQAGS